ncbi:isoprenylcysteine carboxylmethyltransferase family protein [Maribellus sp. CM-23]|uniref:methyltransferase family protein n=1 Tax=Maribellus sp. CM-23 TaxID=2781026 RepID=UPI001F32A98F|nr:isoprenylcysteine carboxylmethyltransferase family protein [Maribellus sp. CM-23]MCE4565590.1 isoprenylcysteine carboxylmethyltransferase family protein [Maribellus sp. CM-23]
MDRIIIFAVLSLLVVAVSWRTIFKLKSHGFYRFISWLCIAWLISTNYRTWFTDPFSIRQIFSWIFLLISAYLVIAGVILLKKTGKPKRDRNDKSLYQFEQTTELVDTGIFKYIRHPLYSSLLFLTWGVFLKNPTLWLSLMTALSSVFLYLTALVDEKECIDFFGDKYIEYMKRSKRFIPFIFEEHNLCLTIKYPIKTPGNFCSPLRLPFLLFGSREKNVVQD